MLLIEAIQPVHSHIQCFRNKIFFNHYDPFRDHLIFRFQSIVLERHEYMKCFVSRTLSSTNNSLEVLRVE